MNGVLTPKYLIQVPLKIVNTIVFKNPIKEAVEAKNRYHHDQIFRGIVLTGVPEWVHAVVPREHLEEKKKALIEQRLQKVSELDEQVAKALILRPHTFEITKTN